MMSAEGGGGKAPWTAVPAGSPALEKVSVYAPGMAVASSAKR